MKTPLRITLAIVAALTASITSGAQDKPQNPPSAEAAAEKAFKDGNGLMNQRKYKEALARYQEGLAKTPRQSGLTLQRRPRGFHEQGFRNCGKALEEFD